MEAGALPDDFFDCMQASGMMALLEQVHGAAIHGEMVPVMQDCPALWGEDSVWESRFFAMQALRNDK